MWTINDCAFTAAQRDYTDNQWTVKKKADRKKPTNQNARTWLVETVEVDFLVSETSATTTDGSEKRKRRLSFRVHVLMEGAVKRWGISLDLFFQLTWAIHE